MSAQSVSVTGNFKVPTPYNEPSREFRPGSPEAASVKKAIAEVTSSVRDLPHVINGERSMTGELRNVVAPHRHSQVLGRIPTADETVIQAAIDAALAAQHDWSRTPWWERAAIFLRAGDLAAGKYRDELVATTMLGQSKTFHQAEIDAASEVADFFRYNAHLAQQIFSDQPAALQGEGNTLDQRGLEGFVLAITPFNFTAIASNLPTTAALMGNVVVWKPSEKSALSNDVLMRMFEEAGLPPGVINLIHGSGRAISDYAMAHPDFAGLNFTGSTDVFRSLWKKTGEHIDQYRSFPRLVGETGGKNAVVAHPSADTGAVRASLIRSAFEYSGQKCSAASRTYLPRSVWNVIKDELIETTKSLRVGDVVEHETFTGAVIDETSLRKLEAAIEKAKGLESHTLLAGGNVHPEEGWFVEPTIFETTDPHAFTMSEEFFGPLLTVYVYEDNEWESVLDLVDQTSNYALTLSIFANDRRAISLALDKLRNASGMTYVNDKPTGALMGQVSFGGGRASGTNDKTGSRLALQRWLSGRFIHENFSPSSEWRQPYLAQ
ncbi:MULTISPECIES: L-glutamate gamma-semialdehyde dehydrogenase [Arthrobacter]|uniref:L-glutamate gamma-semialdehyde dehydrogenase n=1 Tax=Arthrobacter terricola TaxID=2547396 RepID=A0A4R5KAB8_9MICC|nr:MULTISPECIES: L-glutamate gamma-semialdehyde dehydrogenase [Arthrobacter]MBT8163372.1 L-glutamate gamma-semialdehyde dehydrogenase [Arthrobacter sp. GN70]TDF90160.1 L-glutamate gamma-semialdehyde dehydrogenase [Arthrobacter terricola]